MNKTSFASNSPIADIVQTSESSMIGGNGRYKRPSYLPLIEESEDGWLDLPSNLSTYLPVENSKGHGFTARIATGHVQQHHSSSDDGLRVSYNPSCRNATTHVKLMEQAKEADLFSAGKMNEDEDDGGDSDGEIICCADADAKKRGKQQQWKRALIHPLSSPKSDCARTA
mmetsp:Transcript_39712/g.73202  ORF Transcript_39712/g.73202 Transcript_39712/m.73202 type:complete len:170 (-) Transcript_39712:117-626(-)|eukprot:CAMPEP_0197456026 /NCGR_PEP_ID=MMETSP1175-20131217/42308_1 /TAXON_ID=1003142 /ORGANISM="Triceratium dubium, Strain CCMP147" /LENGTH=169 /DNA_ID=CAMNT_0042990033 /DNA_START=359 /DNA_END=868 /DNA_ORIENTATION=+